MNGHGDGGRDGDKEGQRLAAARAYTRRGWRVTPLMAGGKAPTLAGWQQRRLGEEELVRHFAGEANVGLLLGEASGGLVDVDCDAAEAVAAAAFLLPPTGCVSGRASNPLSHYWYVVEGLLPVTAKFADPGARGTETPAHGRAGGMLVELRSTGCQTLAPPSLHPSGERVRWEREGAPGRVTAEALHRAVARVAACALLARLWPGAGARDEAALALAGLLLRGGMDSEEADALARIVARVAGDEEWRRRGKAQGTARRLAEGGQVAAGARLAELLAGDGRRVVAQVAAWLDLTTSGAEMGAGGVPLQTTSGSLGPSAPSAPSAPSVVTHLAFADRLRTIPLWLVEETALCWLWPGRIPLGTITLLDGDPGLGKSLVTLDLVARVTRGAAMPDGGGDATSGAAGIVDGGAVLLSAEDDLAATVRPRLHAAGADVQRVLAVQTVLAYDAATGQDYERGFALPGDIPLLAAAIGAVEAKLLVIDPLMAYLDGRVNSWRDQDVRAALAPLARLAEQTGVAVVILRHLTKGGSTNALYRGGGSIGIIGAARSGLLVARAPEEPEHERILASSKSNLGPPLPALRYRIAPRTPDGDVPAVEWLGPCDYTAATLLGDGGDTMSGEAGTTSGRTTAVDEAAGWLRAQLAAGPRPAAELLAEARERGWSEKTMYAARHRLHVGMRHVGFGPASEWFWMPPADMASQEGDSAPKSALPSMPGPIAENAENAENAIISGLEDSPPPAEYAENGEHESFPLTTTTTTKAGKYPNSAYSANSAQVTEAAVEREAGE
jgi:AAA domain/Bifunctional DNA primase/polymerase, N-terminal